MSQKIRSRHRALVSLTTILLLACGVAAASPAKVGRLGPLIPFHKDAIHASLSLGDPAGPKICFWMRPAEYRGTDLVDPTAGEIGELRPLFETLVYGGFRFSSTLDASVLSRIKADIPRENAQCFNLAHPDAFANTGKYNVADLTPEDFALNAAAFRDAGHSRGLHYNVFCAGNSSLADGRLVVAGGHDKAGNIAPRKINIFDPVTETWADRPIPQVKADYLADPTGTRFPHADPLDEQNTDPPHPSDMRYQRWYPTVVTLPDNKALILSGTDEDSSAGPSGAAITKVRQATPEVYDPATDRTIALENARKLFAMYPRSSVVQTGPGWNDWKVAVMSEVKPPLPTGDELRAFDPWRYSGKTYLLDVQAALADPARDVPAENHWELVDTALAAHESAAAVSLRVLNGRGLPISQKMIVFGGDDGDGNVVSTIEMIDFSRKAKWERQDDLVQPAAQNNAVSLPDGRVLVVGGARGGRPDTVNSFALQMFDPKSGRNRAMLQTNVPRWDHSTALLLPDASVIIMGGNRTDLVPGNPDLGVPVAQVYKPPYLFRGPRPVIKAAPERIAYGSRFTIKVTGRVDSIALLRTGPITHNWAWGNDYVKLASSRRPGERLEVTAPAVPGAAIPGEYMLFAVSKDGVPSVARRVMVGP